MLAERRRGRGATMNVNIGCGKHYAEGWVNVDRVYDAGIGITPDVVNPTGRPILLPYDNVDRVYLGHVLEHVRWEHVASFLAECLGLLRPGGECLIVGPDVNMVLHWWKHDLCDWKLVEAAMEGDHPQVEDTQELWDGARHQWNSTQRRIVTAMQEAGFDTVTAYDTMADVPDSWPSVSRAEWQTAVIGVR